LGQPNFTFTFETQDNFEEGYDSVQTALAAWGYDRADYHNLITDRRVMFMALNTTDPEYIAATPDELNNMTFPVNFSLWMPDDWDPPTTSGLASKPCVLMASVGLIIMGSVM
jgi:hypothetical protein